MCASLYDAHWLQCLVMTMPECIGLGTEDFPVRLFRRPRNRSMVLYSPLAVHDLQSVTRVARVFSH